MSNNRSKSTNPSNSTSNTTDQVVNLTLPITCQICLSRVKDPCVCSNLHAFCSFCIEIWLEKSNHCPTCRTIISPENPCRRILGGIENQNDDDKNKSNDFSHVSIRKARFLSIFQQYEDEIARLSKYIELLNNEISNYKETCNKMAVANANNASHKCDIIPILKSKLQKTQNILDETLSDRENLKEENNRLKTENSVLTEEIMRLKISLTEKNSQISNRHTIASLVAKIESYEKEIKQLQIALDRSDKYISDLEQQNRSKIDEKKHLSLNDSKNSFCSNSSKTKTGQTENIHKNDSKIVKFSEKIDTIIPSNKCEKNYSSNTLFVSSSAQQFNNSKSCSVYGSPSKTNQANCKMNKSIDFEVPSPSQSLLTCEKSLNTDEKWSSYSPKNKDDFSLEKPSFNENEKSLKYSKKKNNQFDDDDDDDEVTEKSQEKFSNSSTLEFKDCLKLLNQAEKKVQSRIITTNSETSFTLLTNTLAPNLANSNATLSSSSFMSTSNLNGPCSSLSMFGNQANYINSHLNKKSNRLDTISDYKTMTSKLKKHTSMDHNLNYQQNNLVKKHCIYDL